MIDRGLALLELAVELHARGHQRLRLMPSMAPSGLYWRLQLSAPGCATWSTAFFADWPSEGTEGVPLLGPAEGRPVLEEPQGGRY